MEHLDLKPTHTAVKNYYAALNQYDQLQIDHEGAVRSAFQYLLSNCAGKFKWTLVPEYPFERKGLPPLRLDGAVLDISKLRRGAWEAKDTHDDLEKEIKHKLSLGYPRDNLIFQAPEKAVLFQNGVRLGLDEDITDPKNLVDLLKKFFEWRKPEHEEWESAVEEFKKQLPHIAAAAKELIDKERLTNKKFVEKFDAFYALCRQAINPNLSEDAVEGMLIQHLLTERIFRKVFDNPDFTRRNVIAQEIEKVIDSLTAKAFNRDAFLASLEHFYKAIELAADSAQGYAEKQQFLNSVYERFFQGYSPKEADTHGIVYTPQPIVDFMVRSVEEILKKEFGRSFSDQGVHILDPFVGTGNFIVRVMKEIKTSALPYKYEHELHCNEVMLMPYYIASMNIEHEYLERTGEYKLFEGICLVDTFDMRAQAAMFAEENTARIDNQRQQTIFVIVGNPPYNAWQLNENDNNKNRKYPALSTRIAETYSKASLARNKNALSDPYVKAIRWASDRINEEGVIAFVTNSGFIEGLAADGMRKTLAQEFDEIYIFDLGGNVRKNPTLSGTIHNVFGIQVGVSINILVRRSVPREQRRCEIHYANTEVRWTREQKYSFLHAAGSRARIEWHTLTPDEKGNWLTAGLQHAFESFQPIGAVLSSSTNGVKTNRDAWLYNFDATVLERNVERSIDFYNAEVARWRKSKKSSRDLIIDNFVKTDDASISWSETLKKMVVREIELDFSPGLIRRAIYRPYAQQSLYFDGNLVERVYGTPAVFPTTSTANKAICISAPGSEKPFLSLMVSCPPDMHLVGAGSGTQCFAFYTYRDDSNPAENIGDSALKKFRTNYYDDKITKWDIFHYVYAVLHHPTYRERYAANLKRELPRIPFVASRESQVASKSVFWQFVEAGRRLAEIHVEYEKQPEYKLERIENPQEKLNWRVEKMRLSKDKSTLFYNDWLTLKGIPPATYEYRLGNRSALEWVVDQYQVSTDKRSGITNDPNRDDDPQYILHLIGQVITVSLETVHIVKSLPELVIDEAKAAKA